VQSLIPGNDLATIKEVAKQPLIQDAEQAEQETTGSSSGEDRKVIDAVILI